MRTPAKIVIIVEGGVVQSVYCDSTTALQATVHVVDYDDLEAEGKTRGQATIIGARKTRNLQMVYG